MYPWVWFDDSDLVIVEMPDGDQNGHCVVLGSGGIERGLAVYRGDQGLAAFLAMMTGAVGPGEFDALNVTDAVAATLCDREELESADYNIIRSLGLRYRGRGRWPLFRAYEPGYFPGRLDADEATFLTTALRAMTFLTLAVQNGQIALDEKDDPQLFLIMSFRDGGWHSRWDFISVPQPPPVKDYPDVERLEQLARSGLTSDSTWELGVFYLPAPLSEGRNQRLYMPVYAALVHADSGYLVSELFTQPGPSDLDRQELLVKILESVPGLPEEVVVNTPRLAMMMESVTAPLGIKLVVGETPALWDAREELFNQLEGEPNEFC